MAKGVEFSVVTRESQGQRHGWACAVHPEENAVVLAVYRAFPEKQDDARLLCAPRCAKCLLEIGGEYAVASGIGGAAP